MTMSIAVPLAAMCVCLLGVLLCVATMWFTFNKHKTIASLAALLFWGFVAGAVISGSFAAVVKLALVFSETP